MIVPLARAGLGLTLFACSSASQAELFDFEQALGGAVVTQTVGDLTVWVTSQNGPIYTYNTTSIDGQPVPGFGLNSLGNFDSGGGYFTANFSAAVRNVGVSGGDWGYDLDTVYLAAYSGLNGAGLLLGSVAPTECCDGSAPSAVSVLLGVRDVQSIVFGTGRTDRYPNSLWFDNIVAEVDTGSVPEPASWSLALIGFGAIGGAMRSRRKVIINFALASPLGKTS